MFLISHRNLNFALGTRTIRTVPRTPLSHIINATIRSLHNYANEYFPFTIRVTMCETDLSVIISSYMIHRRLTVLFFCCFPSREQQRRAWPRYTSECSSPLDAASAIDRSACTVTHMLAIVDSIIWYFDPHIVKFCKD